MQNIANTSNYLHDIPEDISEILKKDKELSKKWDKLTPLSKNEWICWVTIVKKVETRKEHMCRFIEEVTNGKKRPCCWPGCPHRRESAKKWFK